MITDRHEFSEGNEKWFDGKHEKLITQEVFDRARECMKGHPRKTPIGTKEFAFTKMFKCGSCGSGISPDEKIKRLKDGTIRRYVYYGCSKKWITGYKEPWVREESLMDQLLEIIDKVDIQELATVDRIKEEIKRMEKLIQSLGGRADKLIDSIPKIDARSCAKYILKEGTREEKRDLLTQLKTPLAIFGGKTKIL